jgi:hypothetical protein
LCADHAMVFVEQIRFVEFKGGHGVVFQVD